MVSRRIGNMNTCRVTVNKRERGREGEKKREGERGVEREREREKD